MYGGLELHLRDTLVCGRPVNMSTAYSLSRRGMHHTASTEQGPFYNKALIASYLSLWRNHAVNYAEYCIFPLYGS